MRFTFIVTFLFVCSCAPTEATVGRCSDAIVDDDESCDDGNTTSGDGCSATCEIERPASCGNGVDDDGEECDDGNLVNQDGCSALCTLEAPVTCGNGVDDAGEECDDGNTLNNDGCSSTCTIEIPATCGNAADDANEECDDGNNVNDDGCSAVCVIERCGDGIRSQARAEECDDGNVVSFDGCSASCVIEFCGDNVLQGNTEECDDGNRINDDGCSDACDVERCGDQIVHQGEACDDGNVEAFDGCGPTCAIERCGDGVLQGPRGEECDDENDANNDGCSSLCRIERCGDTIVQSSEFCDDGNLLREDGCFACRETSCGDGRSMPAPDMIVLRSFQSRTQFVDINHDGFFDVFANDQTQAQVFRGSSTGITIDQTYIFSFSGQDAHLLDVNGDGELDMVGLAPANLQIRLGNGNFGFAAPTVVSFQPATAFRLVSSDLNGDDQPDFIVLHRTPLAISIVLSQPDRSYRVETTTTFTGQGIGLAYADFVLDAKEDLVVLDQNASQIVVMQIGAAFEVTEVQRIDTVATARLITGRFDEDEKHDVVVACCNVNANLHLGGVDGIASGISLNHLSFKSLEITTTPLDGHDAFVFMSQNAVSVAQVRAGEVVVVESYEGIAEPSPSAAAFVTDLNGDDERDLLAPNLLTNIFFSIDDKAGLGFLRDVFVGLGVKRLAVQNVDGDAAGEIVWNTDSSTTVARGATLSGSSGVGVFARRVGDAQRFFYAQRATALKRVDPETSAETETLATDAICPPWVNDFEGDGIDEILYGTGAELVVLFGATGTARVPFAGCPVDVRFVPLVASDNTFELITTNGVDTTVHIMRFTTSAVEAVTSFVVPGFFERLEVGDLDDDARADLLLSRGTTHVLSLNLASGFVSQTPAFVARLPKLVDVDQDGRVDVIDVEGTGARFQRRTSALVFAAPVRLQSSPLPAEDIAVGDVNGDGFVDIASFASSRMWVNTQVEGCDDGNHTSSDGCSSVCMAE